MLTFLNNLSCLLVMVAFAVSEFNEWNYTSRAQVDEQLLNDINLGNTHIEGTCILFGPNEYDVAFYEKDEMVSARMLKEEYIPSLGHEPFPCYMPRLPGAEKVVRLLNPNKYKQPVTLNVTPEIREIYSKVSKYSTSARMAMCFVYFSALLFIVILRTFAWCDSRSMAKKKKEQQRQAQRDTPPHLGRGSPSPPPTTATADGNSSSKNHLQHRHAQTPGVGQAEIQI